MKKNYKMSFAKFIFWLSFGLTNNPQPLISINNAGQVIQYNDVNDLAKNFYARLILSQQINAENKSNLICSEDEFKSYLKNLNFDQKAQLTQGIKQYILINLDFDNLQNEIFSNFLLKTQYNSSLIELNSNLAINYIVSQGTGLNDKINAAVQEASKNFYTSQRNKSLEEKNKTIGYKIYEFATKNDAQDYLQKRYSMTPYLLNDFYISDILSYHHDDRKAFFNSEFLELQKGNLKEKIVTYDSKVYIIEITNVKEDIDLSKFLNILKQDITSREKSSYIQNFINTNTKLVVNSETKSFTLNDMVYDEKNILSSSILQAVFLRMHMSKNKIEMDKLPVVTERDVLSAYKELSQEEFKTLIEQPQIREKMFLLHYYDKNQASIVKMETNNLQYESNKVQINMQILMTYYMLKYSNDIQKKVNEKTNKLLDEYWAKDDNQKYFKARLYMFKNEFDAEAFFDEFNDKNISELVQKRSNYYFQDISDVLFCKLIDFSLAKNLSDTYKVYSYVQKEIQEDTNFNFNIKLPRLVYISSNIHGYYLVGEIYEAANMNSEQFISFAKKINTEIIQMEYQKIILEEINQKYKNR